MSVSLKSRGPLKAVILDWAGTVVDYGSFAPVAAFVRLFEQHGVAITIEEARRPMGMDKKSHILELLSMNSVKERWRSITGREPDEAGVEKLYQDFLPLQREALLERAGLIPGTLEAVAEFRRGGLKVGSTTGYSRELMDVLVPEAARRGFTPDSVVCASDVPAGRPEPWMALLSAQQMRVYPPKVIVKVGDTLPDIAEGLNAGMWAVGLALTGNELGLDEEAVKRLPTEELSARRAHITSRMLQAGAHYVVDGLWDVPRVLDEIEARLARGEGP
jgi:phosphonoacetaldehyde hydrolase